LDKDVVPIIAHTAGPKRVVLGRKSSGKEVMAGDATGVSKWKKWMDALFHLDDLQEKASNNFFSAMTSFVQRTHVVIEVCIPCRAPWRILDENPSWCS
jgi:hypothetical protein